MGIVYEHSSFVLPNSMLLFLLLFSVFIGGGGRGGRLESLCTFCYGFHYLYCFNKNHALLCCRRMYHVPCRRVYFMNSYYQIIIIIIMYFCSCCCVVVWMGRVCMFTFNYDSHYPYCLDNCFVKQSILWCTTVAALGLLGFCIDCCSVDFPYPFVVRALSFFFVKFITELLLSVLFLVFGMLSVVSRCTLYLFVHPFYIHDISLVWFACGIEAFWEHCFEHKLLSLYALILISLLPIHDHPPPKVA